MYIFVLRYLYLAEGARLNTPLDIPSTYLPTAERFKENPLLASIIFLKNQLYMYII